MTCEGAADAARLREAERITEALIFASAMPVSEAYIRDRIADGIDVRAMMLRLREDYAGRGVNLVQVDDAWAFRTAADLSFIIRRDEHEVRKLSRAALEVLSIVAYHQPVTRAEIEDIRGVQTSKGTLDVLMEAGWVRFRGRRRTPGRPVTLGTTRDFLDHFGLEELRDLPGLEELKGAGLLTGRIPANFAMPSPVMSDELTEDEDPITQLDLEELGLLAPTGAPD
ncbi:MULTISPECIES: SMC-Scp complex subunit ScpB [unclassified Rhizobium]|uniref:SMC-Scp complex subunit ScpB n=1 Tax=unclassified Rhizobium TaxID=2613769 RepID=UPI001AD97212|nr:MULTISPECIES: SMC-Scp complex subunit ScpB [unclassified Rhizobium]MBO9098708.1 SMC-Scp complex subunit ScpB [Rhizobium sp. L58/93]MBO9132487.1 SMC-Scp complex subunit ScpB [Rhizobium sp. B209b/85]MBO9168974.1 SMC-Scp complex subunit ScpB [Rhizobium sp. L245/93]MBO9184924.1 SMC-Scp complex subunit ScpB [Rhizobium sp. E27B/91]QXZ85087.1 SMC-Scp complex subunit ScpB [Rhizobium sp. K1/93]